MTRSAALVSEVLRDAGYNTFAVGKWHVAPMRETSPAGPFDEWPLGRGFNQLYGFMNGATDHYCPELVRDNHAVFPPATPEEGYHLTSDLVDRSHIELSTAPPFGSAAAYRIEAVLSGQKSGVIVAYGNFASGFVLYVDSGTLHYEHNSADSVTRAAVALPSPAAEGLLVALEFEKTAAGGATVQLHAGDACSDPAHIDRSLSFLALAGMSIGHNPLSPVSTAYLKPFPFAGEIERVSVVVQRDEAAEPQLLDD